MQYREDKASGAKLPILGFGCMRFPRDKAEAERMILTAVEGGVNYFDTAYIYHDSKSEEFTGRFLKDHSGLSREQYYIATKLPTWEVGTLDDAKRIFAEQLKRLQVDYIDFYMLHDLKIDRFEKMEDLGVYDYCRELQKQGKIKYFGHSSHENIENFKKIADSREWDFVMLHLNYMDADNVKLYDYATQKGIPVLAMETVKGGSLSNLPADILKYFAAVNTADSPSSWAIRWAGSMDNVKVILSGMSDMAQVKDNLSTCSDFVPLTEQEYSAIEKVSIDLRKRVRNDCTGCNYCMPCPEGVNIPWVFSIWNNYGIYENRGHSNWEWSMVKQENRPAKCTQCGKCNDICPQNIDVIADLEKVSEEMNLIKW
jgi:hypothetical protein